MRVVPDTHSANKLFNKIYTTLFGKDFTDIFSGYRVFNQRFAKSFPALSGGFEIETEMSVHASMLRMPVSELTLDYGRRPEGSSSKLSTYRDGMKILWTLMLLMKETRPFLFFSAISGAFLLASIAFMAPVLSEYFDSGTVSKVPTWIAAIALLMISMLFFVSGVILDSLARSRAEHKRMLYMGLPTTRSLPRVIGDDQRRSRGKARKNNRCMIKRLFSFVVVGGIGFVTDAGLLMGLLRFTALDPFTARLIAIAAALQVTWLLNRNFTFGKSTRHAAVEGMRYGGVGIATQPVELSCLFRTVGVCSGSQTGVRADHRFGRGDDLFLYGLRETRFRAVGVRRISIPTRIWRADYSLDIYTIHPGA